MADLSVHSQFPDLLVIHGTDLVRRVGIGTPDERDAVVSGWRAALRAVLFDPANGVRDFRGVIDFVLCFVADGRVPNFSGEDHSTVDVGRPFRGIAQMPGHYDLGASVPSQLGRKVGGVGHEFSHYWLVPGTGRIDSSRVNASFPTRGVIEASLLAGEGLPPYPIIGRQYKHWSPYCSLDSSAQEAAVHISADPGFEAGVGYTFDEAVAPPEALYDVPGHGQVATRRFGHLERYLMGLIDDHTAGNLSFHVLQSRWVFPMPFHSGLYVESVAGKWYLGFLEGPNRLGLREVGGSGGWSEILSEPFNPHDRVAFRVVRWGAGPARLQVRVWTGPRYPALQGCLYEIARRLGIRFVRGPFRRDPLPCSAIVADVVQGNLDEHNDMRAGWRTVGEVSASRVGLSTRHLQGGSPYVRTTARLCLWHEGVTSELPLETLDFDPGSTSPDPAPRLLDQSLILPWAVGRRSDGTVDDAPKATLQAPDGDFVLGGQFDLEECLLATSAGGAARGKTYVGSRVRHALPHFDFVSSNKGDWELRRAEPEDGEYRCLFCILSPEPLPDADLTTKLGRLDLIRRGWEAGFPVMAPATGTPRAIHSRMSEWS